MIFFASACCIISASRRVIGNEGLDLINAGEKKGAFDTFSPDFNLVKGTADPTFNQDNVHHQGGFS